MKWTIHEEPGWPFDVEIHDSHGNCVASFERCSLSYAAETLDDCYAAVGFDADKRQQVIEDIQRQMADIRLQAAAPLMLRAIKAFRKAERTHCTDDHDKAMSLISQCYAAIRKPRK